MTIPVHIIGLGLSNKDLTRQQKKIIEACDLLVGGKRLLSFFEYLSCEKISITSPISKVITKIKSSMDTKQVVVLASGDPLFHGIGSTLLKHMDKADLVIHPNISSVAAAFAKIKEPWHDACLISLHGKSKKDFNPSEIAKENRVAILTDPNFSPAAIASKFIEANIANFTFWVLENIGSEKEKISCFDDTAELKNNTYSHPNLVLLIKKEGLPLNVSHETHIGMPDEAFAHEKGLITKSEIRSITLSKLKLSKNNHLLWDIGAGSGSVSIEASFMMTHGKIITIEKNPERIKNIQANILKFGCHNLTVLNTNFPNGIKTLDTPDRIFIGGGGENLELIISKAIDCLAPGGIIVINTVLLENLDAACRILEKKGLCPQVTQIQISRSKPMPFGKRMAALNPVWIISGEQP
ncbi:MAG: precorrin-6y C5,15-methyltransferase (decarboxylating) subunit CbiE [Desulfobacteraceae bacterium]|nr:precorrin-6y C5,15-methyltransferase (decarboxylating) subunit CbiE [Desulfobacteraceae bacterium]